MERPLSVGLALIVVGAILLAVLDPPHRRPPEPAGMVLRVELGPVRTPGREILVVPRSPSGSGALFVASRDDAGRKQWLEVSYPGGETRAGPAPPLASPPPFDLDGDGVVDRVVSGAAPHPERVEVVSGMSGAVLFAQEDPLEYECPDRAFPLGDLDGDGYGELALAHPRMDRSRYDPEPADRAFGARSWVTVVSGARLAR